MWYGVDCNLLGALHWRAAVCYQCVIVCVKITLDLLVTRKPTLCKVRLQGNYHSLESAKSHMKNIAAQTWTTSTREDPLELSVRFSVE